MILKQANKIRSLWKELEYKGELKNRNFSSITVPSCGELNLGEGWQYLEEHGPFTTTQWGQGAGYNTYIPPAEWPYPSCSIDQNGRQLVVCVAVAVAQIMAYNQFPATCNWSLMPNSPGTLHTAALMHEVDEAVNTIYGCNYSFSDGTAARRALDEDFGYANATKSNYNFQTVYENIKWGKPVILFANAGFLEGHMWVADGVQWNEFFTCVEVEDASPGGGENNRGVPGPQYVWSSYYSSKFLRMNWGWNGSFNNAWYNAFIWTVDGDTYDGGMKMITGLTP